MAEIECCDVDALLDTLELVELDGAAATEYDTKRKQATSTDHAAVRDS